MVDFHQRRRCVLLAVVTILATTLVMGRSRTVSAAEEIDAKAAAVLDKYVEATGGKAAYDKIKNRVSKMSVDMVGQGVTLDMTVYVAKPNKSYMLIESDAVGKIEQGCDGAVAWSNTTNAGPQILEGAQKATVLRDAILDRFAYWRSVCVGAKYVGTEEVDGAECHKIVLTPKPVEGGPKDDAQTLFVDTKTNLIVKMDAKFESPMGVIPVSVVMSDYKVVDGVKLAFKTTMKVMGTERVITISEVKNNVDLPADRFALPPEVKELVK